MKLNHKQTAALDYLEDQETNELLYGGAAGGGKSMLGCYWVLKMCHKYPGTRWVIGRASMKTLKETTLVTFFKVAKMQGLRPGIHYRYLDNPKNHIEFPNGSFILLKDLESYPSDPDFDDLGSLEITGAFIDEANQITAKAKGVLFSRVRHGLDENGIIPKLLMTCNPAKNFVYKDFYRPHKDGKLPSYRKFIQAFVRDNPDISRHYEENLSKLDAASIARLRDGNWEYDNDPSILMIYDKIIDIFTNQFVPDGERFMTIDVARFGKDYSVFGIWSGFRVKLHRFHGLKVTETAEKAREFQKMFNIANSNTIADEDGVGGGVVDILGCKGFVNNSSPIGIIENDQQGDQGDQKPNYANLKSQCSFAMATRVNKNGIFVELGEVAMADMLTEEMEQVKKKDIDKDGKNTVVSKDKVKEIIGRSPDLWDTIMMREYFELNPLPEWQLY